MRIKQLVCFAAFERKMGQNGSSSFLNLVKPTSAPHHLPQEDKAVNGAWWVCVASFKYTPVMHGWCLETP